MELSNISQGPLNVLKTIDQSFINTSTAFLALRNSESVLEIGTLGSVNNK